MQEAWVQSLGQEDPLEKEMAIHSSILAWRIPWTEEPGRLQSMGSQASDTTERLNHHHHHIVELWRTSCQAIRNNKNKKIVINFFRFHIKGISYMCLSLPDLLRLE